MRDAAKDFTFVLDDIEGLVNACQHAFGPDDDPDHHWPDEEDVSHPPTGITFGMIRRRGWPWRRSDVHSPDAASVPAEPCVDCTHDYCRCAAREGVAASDYEQVRRTLGLLLSALRSGEGVSQAVEEEVARGLGALKRLAGKVEE